MSKFNCYSINLKVYIDVCLVIGCADEDNYEYHYYNNDDDYTDVTLVVETWYDPPVYDNGSYGDGETENIIYNGNWVVNSIKFNQKTFFMGKTYEEGETFPNDLIKYVEGHYYIREELKKGNINVFVDYIRDLVEEELENMYDGYDEYDEEDLTRW